GRFVVSQDIAEFTAGHRYITPAAVVARVPSGEILGDVEGLRDQRCCFLRAIHVDVVQLAKDEAFPPESGSVSEHTARVVRMRRFFGNHAGFVNRLKRSVKVTRKTGSIGKHTEARAENCLVVTEATSDIQGPPCVASGIFDLMAVRVK